MKSLQHKSSSLGSFHRPAKDKNLTSTAKVNVQSCLQSSFPTDLKCQVSRGLMIQPAALQS